LGALERSKGARATRARRILQSVGRLPALAPALNGIDRAAHLVGNVRMAPGGLLMGEQQQARSLHFRERRGGAGAELLQAPFLCRGQVDGILGQRSWHDYSPPDQAKVSGIVICQDFAHVKPAAYLLRTVLSAPLVPRCGFRQQVSASVGLLRAALLPGVVESKPCPGTTAPDPTSRHLWSSPPRQPVRGQASGAARCGGRAATLRAAWWSRARGRQRRGAPQAWGPGLGSGMAGSMRAPVRAPARPRGAGVASLSLGDAGVVIGWRGVLCRALIGGDRPAEGRVAEADGRGGQEAAPCLSSARPTTQGRTVVGGRAGPGGATALLGSASQQPALLEAPGVAAACGQGGGGGGTRVGRQPPNTALEATGHSVRLVAGVGLYRVARASAWAFGFRPRD